MANLIGFLGLKYTNTKGFIKVSFNLLKAFLPYIVMAKLFLINFLSI